MPKKFTVSDFNLKTDGLPAEQKTFMENIVGMMCEVVNKSLEGFASPEEVTKQFGDINNLLKAYRENEAERSFYGYYQQVRREIERDA